MKAQKLDAYGALKAEIFQHPAIPSKVKTWRYQWICFPLLFSLPLLALFGFFDENMMTHTLEQDGLKTVIEYPTKIRYGEEEHLRIEIKNESNLELKNVSSYLSREYLEKFDDVAFTPQVSNDYQVKFETIPAGAKRYIDIKIKGGEYGDNEGLLTIKSDGKELLNQNLKTFVFP